MEMPPTLHQGATGTIPPVQSVAMLAGLLLVAMNLRPAFTSVGPVLSDIRSDLGLSGAAAALLTGLPVVCLGLLAPLAPVFSRRLGVERSIGGALVVLVAGLLLRAAGGVLPLAQAVVGLGAGRARFVGASPWDTTGA